MNQNELFSRIKELVDSNMVTLPPKCHEFLEGKFVNYVEGESLTMTFPLYEKYSNPVGVVLGGFIPLFFDSTMGPLAYLIAKKPVSSLDLNTTFISPLRAAEKEVIITASFVSMSKSYLILEGKAYNSNKKLIATGTSRLKIFDFPK